MLEHYLNLVGAALANAEVFKAYNRENRRNKELIEAVHGLFEEQQFTLEAFVRRCLYCLTTVSQCKRSAVILMQYAKMPIRSMIQGGSDEVSLQLCRLRDSYIVINLSTGREPQLCIY
ncbi:unnamed protein product [Protopolystoma xenopodis]|uniref:Uncharacterized protein n=1 Tax=Protopolystoma xenopodis TaxID=117903 RepID=A0A448X3I7_9PLAT|nr:unnamed protein product [Protopolystoma xenopodis]